jgi:predicted ATP-dependent endonuclease of OLD family
MHRFMWIFVEGKDDRRFVNAILLPILKKEYDYVDAWEYAQEPPKKTIDFLRAMKSMKSDCLFLADIDDSPCVTAKKDRLLERFRHALEPAEAFVVAKEIESWYVAGVDDQACRELGIASLSRTDNLTKEQFRRMMPKRFNDSVVDFTREILQEFRIELARVKNRSFGYLMDKLEARSKKV